MVHLVTNQKIKFNDVITIRISSDVLFILSFINVGKFLKNVDILITNRAD